MRHLELLFFAVWGYFLFPEALGEHLGDSKRRDLYQADNKFKCPFVFGAFPDPDDCSNFYVCLAGASFHKKCPLFTQFDVLRRKCLPMLVAICGHDKNKGKSTTSISSSTSTQSVTVDNFVCSSIVGSFPYPDDCSKYYYCLLYRHSVKTCPEKELFDAVKKTCKPEGQVHCGTRPRPPGFTTTAIVPETDSTTESVTEQTSIDTDTTTNEDATTVSETTVEDIITTTEAQLTGPPEHNCDKDDLDCIITETGDVIDWFKCPEDVGSYVHPSSDQLFIFCMNWIPSAKKCGQDLVFSKELSTCVEIKYML